MPPPAACPALKWIPLGEKDGHSALDVLDFLVLFHWIVKAHLIRLDVSLCESSWLLWVSLGIFLLERGLIRFPFC